MTMASTTFRVRKLPDPTPFIAFKDAQGNTDHYRGGKPFAKSLLLASPGLSAAIDDGLLDTPFEVLSFETVFFDSSGNAMPEVSAGSQFSQRQESTVPASRPRKTVLHFTYQGQRSRRHHARPLAYGSNSKLSREIMKSIIKKVMVAAALVCSVATVFAHNRAAAV